MSSIAVCNLGNIRPLFLNIPKNFIKPQQFTYIKAFQNLNNLSHKGHIPIPSHFVPQGRPQNAFPF